MTELVLRQASIVWRSIQSMDRVWILVALIPLLVATFDPDGLTAFVKFAVSALLNTLPYITLAVLLIGGLKATGAEGLAAAAFKGRENRMIVVAALVGGMAPFCSCEVIPFIAALLAAGAPLSAVMAFWLSSPLMDPPQFLITIEALGLEYAVAKVIAAVAIGLMGGFAMKLLLSRGIFANPLRADFSKAGSCCAATSGCGAAKTTPDAPVWRFWHEPERVAKFRDAALENAIFLLKWMSLAYMLESALVHYVPADLIGSIVGGEGVTPIVIGALVGAPAYLNGYAAPALVAGLMEQGMSPGAAMSFMIAGAVSSIPAMAAVFALVRKPVFGMYVGLGIGGAIASGLLFATLLPLI